MTEPTIRAPTLRVGGKFGARVFGPGSEAARARVRSALFRRPTGSSGGEEPVTVRFERFVLELATAAGRRKISRKDLTVRLDLDDAGVPEGAAPRPAPGPTGNGNGKGSAVPPAAPPEAYRDDDFLRILVKMMVLVWAMGDEEAEEDDDGSPGAGAEDDEEREDGGEDEGMFGLF